MPEDLPQLVRDYMRAGEKLRAKYGQEAIPGYEIKQLVVDIAEGRYKDVRSIPRWPTDYCYNRINKANDSFVYNLFEAISRGWNSSGKAEFLYLGLGFPYSGDILWDDRKVGEWRDGRCFLEIDPRDSSRQAND